MTAYDDKSNISRIGPVIRISALQIVNLMFIIYWNFIPIEQKQAN